MTLPEVPRRNDGPRWFWRAGLTLAAVALTLAVVEVGARIFAGLTDQSRGMTFDTELGWRPLPNVRKIGGVWGVTRPATTNSQGWRDREHSARKDPGQRRIVAIGDSFTFGVDVDDGERVTDVLGKLMDRVDVVNLGVAGYGTDQELRVLESHAFAFDPDAIVLSVCTINDLDDIRHARIYSQPKPTYRLVDGALVFTPPTRTWDVSLREHSYLAEWLFQRVQRGQMRAIVRSDVSDADAVTLFEALVRRIRDETAARRVPLVAVLASATDKADPKGRVTARIMTAVLANLGIPMLDVRALFAGRSIDPDTQFFSPIGGHWNPEGQALVAQGVRDLLAQAGVR
jgi:lysophospholipase L1-like esterase